MNVVRFKGSYDTHTHVSTYNATASPCRVNLPSAKISIRAATLRLFKWNVQFPLPLIFRPYTTIQFFSHLPIVRIAWSNEFFARLPLSFVFFSSKLYIRGRKLYNGISSYKRRIRHKTPPLALRIIWITSSWSYCWNFTVALTAIALKMWKQCPWDVYR